jgi:uncharacterized membrane protein
MTSVYIGVILFAGTHLFSMLMPAARDSLKARLGENAFKGVYSIVGLIGIALMVYGYSNAWATGDGIMPVYDPPTWGRHVAMLFVLLGFILIGASHGKGHLKLWLRSPTSIGVALWALGHLLANGFKLDLWIFGTFLALGVLDVILCAMRGKGPTHEPQLRSDIIAVIVGVVLYAVLLFGFHPYVLGVPVVP